MAVTCKNVGGTKSGPGENKSLCLCLYNSSKLNSQSLNPIPEYSKPLFEWAVLSNF